MSTDSATSTSASSTAGRSAQTTNVVPAVPSAFADDIPISVAVGDKGLTFTVDIPDPRDSCWALETFSEGEWVSTPGMWGAGFYGDSAVDTPLALFAGTNGCFDEEGLGPFTARVLNEAVEQSQSVGEWMRLCSGYPGYTATPCTRAFDETGAALP